MKYSFLKWAGGKGRTFHQYKEILPNSKQIKIYCEPFCGSASMFFQFVRDGAAFDMAILADANYHLIQAFQAVRDEPDAVVEQLKHYKEKHSQAFYQSCQDLTVCLPKVEKAAKFIYLNRASFNGLYRENSKGQYNVPWNREEKLKIQEEKVLEYSAMLQNTHCWATEFLETLSFIEGFLKESAHLREEVLIYCDPPYHPITHDSFVKYRGQGFGQKDRQALADGLQRLSKYAIVAVSDSYCQMVYDLYKDFQIHIVQGGRSINSKGSDRAPVKEILALA